MPEGACGRRTSVEGGLVKGQGISVPSRSRRIKKPSTHGKQRLWGSDQPGKLQEIVDNNELRKWRRGEEREGDGGGKTVEQVFLCNIRGVGISRVQTASRDWRNYG